MGIRFRMVTLHDMIICELCLGRKQGEGERVFCSFFRGWKQGCATRIDGRQAAVSGFWVEYPK